MKPFSRLSVICESIIEAGWLIAIILAPLYFNVNTYRIFDSDKVALIQVLVSVMGMAWLIKWLEQRGDALVHSPNKLATPLVLPTLALVLVKLVTTLTAISPYTSIFGSFIRPQGTPVLLAYLALFALMTQGLTTRKQIERLLTTLIITSLPIALYAIIQNLRLDPLTWDREIAGRVFAMLGNPIFLGAYLIIIFFVTLGRTIVYARAARLVQAGLHGTIALAQAAALLFTVSRGPWVGWLAGLFLFALMLAWTLQRRRAMQITAILSMLGIAAVGMLNVPNTPLEPLRNAPYVGALAHIFEGESGTGRVRTLLWEANARVFFERPVVQFPDGSPDRLHFLRPLVGYGPEAMSAVFTQFRVSDDISASLKEDHSHNETWDVLFNHGILGLIAYQWLWLAIFLLGLNWLGLATTRRARIEVTALWFGGGLGLGFASILLGQPAYWGIALPVGNMTGLTIFVLSAAWRRTAARIDDSARTILIAALLAALAAHYVEIQFGINLVTTRVMFWTCVALLLALGTHPFDVASFKAIPRGALAYALIGATILVIVLFEFTQHVNGAAPAQTLWQSLTVNSLSGQSSFAILGLVLVTWLGTALVGTLECAVRDERRRIFGIVASGSFALALIFGLGYGALISALSPLPAQLADPLDGTRTADQLTGLTDFFLVSLAILFILLVVAFASATGWQAPKWAYQRWHGLGSLGLLASTLVVSSIIFLAPIRADAYIKVGLFLSDAREPQAAILAFSRALALTPLADRPYMLLGNAYANHAFYLDMSKPSQFGDTTRLEQILEINSARLATLNRNDTIYAAQTMYLSALNLNPLYPDHSVNLARLYKPEPPVNTPGKIKLAELSTKYYTQATRLAPNDMELWNEWASFDVTYWENPAAALDKLQQAAQRDPQFAPTFVQMGDIYKSQSQPAQAIAAYQRALAAKLPPAEAASKLAFLYYQQGKFADAIAAYQKYLELAPDSGKAWEAHKNLALLYEQIGARDSALRSAQRARELAPADVHAQLDEWIARLSKP